MRLVRRVAALVALALATPVAAAETDDDGGSARMLMLEQRIEELEAALGRGGNEGLGDWTRRVRLSGSANGGYFHRAELSPWDSDAFRVWDARFFLDAELFDGGGSGERPLVRNVGLSFEWNLVRLGELQNNVGNLFVDFQAFGGSPWANAQVGRFQIPVGESYLRYDKGVASDPFYTQSLGPWWWDEGVRLYGNAADGRFGYVASVSSGETDFGATAGGDPQGTLKLLVRPWPWLLVSMSGLVSGEIGSQDEPAAGALWLGEMWARAFGSGTGVPSYVDGAPVARGPNVLDGTWLAGADVVATPVEHVRTWLAWGRYDIDSAGASLYDRTISYWIAEMVLGGGLVAPWLEPLTLGLRTNRLTTGDDERGYLLDLRHSQTLGYNMQSLFQSSAVLAWWFGRHLVVRGQYDYQRIDLVEGVSAAIAGEAEDGHAFSLNVGGSF